MQAKDISPKSIEFLKAHGQAEHVFGDILGMFLLPQCWNVCLPLHHKTFIIKHAQLVPHCYCWRHGTRCPVRGGQYDCSGPPCTDFSPSGLQLGRHGPTNHTFLAYCFFHLYWQTPLLTLENVREFDRPWLFETMGGTYKIYPLDVSTDDCGFGLIARDRSYFLLVHRSKADLVYDIYQVYDVVKEAIRNETSPMDALMASSAEIWCEFTVACQQRRVSGPVPPVSRIPWEITFTQPQLERLRVFNMLIRDRFRTSPGSNSDLVYLLNDNPLNRTNWSAISGRIPTLRTGSTLLWYPSVQRILTSREILACMGFPTYEHLGDAMGAGKVDMTHMSSGSDLKHMTGNAMHLANVTVVMLVVLACCRLNDGFIE